MLKETIKEIDRNIRGLSRGIDYLFEDHFANITDTIHSFFAVDYNNCSKSKNGPNLTKRVRQFEVILIDEYSMIGNKLFKAIATILASVSRATGINSANYFGRFLVILTGDLCRCRQSETNQYPTLIPKSSESILNTNLT